MYDNFKFLKYVVTEIETNIAKKNSENYIA